MKNRIILIAVLLFSLSGINHAQEKCKKFHLYGTCMQYSGPNFKYDGQSRSNVIGFGDKLTYNIVFYGDRQYKIYVCTSTDLAPVHFKLINPMTREVIYDNKEDNYLENLTLNIDFTQNILVEMEVIASEATPERKYNFLGCSGILIEWKPKGAK